MNDLKLEICANGVEAAINAYKGGAERIELCANLAEGGTTPSFGTIKFCVDNLNLDVWPIIRPRGGDFCYTAQEFESMLNDILNCKLIGCKGIVAGILDINGNIDVRGCEEIIAASAPMQVAFHRAFDMSANLSESLETIIELGFVRVLTSGAKANALEGATIIKKLIHQANGRIEIMPGAGITTENIRQIAITTGAKSFHTTAKGMSPSKMLYKNECSKMGAHSDEYITLTSDYEKVKQLKQIITNI